MGLGTQGGPQTTEHAIQPSVLRNGDKPKAQLLSTKQIPKSGTSFQPCARTTKRGPPGPKF
jgi:hypothetical protein